MLQPIVIRATHTQEVLGEQGRRIRELTSLIQKRFKFPENSVSLYAAKVQNRGLSAVAQCESLRYKLLNGLAVRRACYGVLRFIMESGAKGCEVVVSGKLRAARAKSMKFTVCLTSLLISLSLEPGRQFVSPWWMRLHNLLLEFIFVFGNYNKSSTANYSTPITGRLHDPLWSTSKRLH
jgi:ribosomal protein uS3